MAGRQSHNKEILAVAYIENARVRLGVETGVGMELMVKREDR